MWVYIGTSELNSAYIGEVYEYSYDFRNKSSTQVTNDGWELTRWTLALNANWLYWTSGDWNELYIQLTKMNTALANANKVTLKMLGKHWNSWTASNSFFIMQGKYPNATKSTWLYYTYGSSNSYYYGGTPKSFTYTQPSSWTAEYTYEVDLQAKTVTLTFIQWGSGVFTTNISDTDVTNIRTNNHIRCAVAWTNDAISEINILIV